MNTTNILPQNQDQKRLQDAKQRSAQALRRLKADNMSNKWENQLTPLRIGDHAPDKTYSTTERYSVVQDRRAPGVYLLISNAGLVLYKADSRRACQAMASSYFPTRCPLCGDPGGYCNCDYDATPAIEYPDPPPYEEPSRDLNATPLAPETPSKPVLVSHHVANALLQDPALHTAKRRETMEAEYKNLTIVPLENNTTRYAVQNTRRRNSRWHEVNPTTQTCDCNDYQQRGATLNPPQPCYHLLATWKHLEEAQNGH